MQATSATGNAAQRRTRACGFTLVEIMVVVTIMALIAASMPFAINRLMPARRVSLAAERLGDDVRWLQAGASSNGAAARLTVTPGGYRMQIDGGNSRNVDLPGGAKLHLETFAGDRALREAVFYPDGTASPVRLEIVDSNRRAAVEVAMLTGRARRTR